MNKHPRAWLVLGRPSMEKTSQFPQPGNPGPGQPIGGQPWKMG